VTTLADLLRAAAAQLRGAGVADGMRDARILLAHASGIAPDRLTLHLHDLVPVHALPVFQDHIQRRALREPVWRILGQRSFYGRSFQITPDVLDPRPETEILIEAALAQPFSNVLDLGTGSGCIVLTLLAERADARGLGTDLSRAALEVAQGNAVSLGLSDRAQLSQSDWYGHVVGKFDLIVSNPPYIAASEMPDLSPEVLNWDPHMALSPGGDGLAPYRAIAAGACAHLSPKGRLIVEIGPTQAQSVGQMFDQSGLLEVTISQDLDGRDRIVSARAP
jgi:release factor glutamine methyltransferase